LKLPRVSSNENVHSPDDIMSGNMPDGPVVVYDDDHYYMGTVIAQCIQDSGAQVTLVTPQDTISSWGLYTNDRRRAQTRLMQMGVKLVVAQSLEEFSGVQADFRCNYTGAQMSIECASLVMVTARQPNDGLYNDLSKSISDGSAGMPKSIKRIGDCEAPAIIAAAVYSGHRYARHLDENIDADNPLKHDRVFFEDA
jgi:dimethylamine/trimethylamine dehydrogenase